MAALCLAVLAGCARRPPTPRPAPGYEARVDSLDTVELTMLEGRRIVVTGASSGIGRALVRSYAGTGARVVAVARREEELSATAAGLAALDADPIEE